MNQTNEISGIVKKLSSYTYSAQHESKSSVNINQVLKNAVRMIERTKDTTGIVFDLDFATLPHINASTGEITQAFMALITNAVDAIRDRGGVVSVRTRVVGDTVHCVIKDTGMGISENNLDRVFEPFFTTKEEGKGTGLGLYVCYRILMKHRGTIDVQSSPGEGTTFTINLPLPQNDD